MKKLILSFLSLSVLICSGCFTRIPTKNNEAMNENVGKIGILSRDMILVNFLQSKVAWNLEEEKNLGQNQQILRKINEGSKVQIESVAYRRLPAGVFYVYVCKNLENEDIFEIESSRFDAINIITKS